MVGGAVFEVAVLQKLGIEAAVGAVVDVLEEDADELVGDGFGAVGIDGDVGVDGSLGEACKACGVVGQRLGIKAATLALCGLGVLKGFDVAEGYTVDRAFQPAAIDYGFGLALLYRGELLLQGLEALGHGVVLRAPVDEVDGGGVSVLASAGTDAECEVPQAVRVARQLGRVHLLIRSPLCEIALDERCSVGYALPAVPIGRVGEREA